MFFFIAKGVEDHPSLLINHHNDRGAPHVKSDQGVYPWPRIVVPLADRIAEGPLDVIPCIAVPESRIRKGQADIKTRLSSLLHCSRASLRSKGSKRKR